MSPRLSFVALAGMAPLFAGCGGDAKEEAPGAATAAVIAQAPVNAVGHEIDRPTPPPVPTKVKAPDPTPIHPGPKLAPSDDPLAPEPAGKPKKGTDL